MSKLIIVESPTKAKTITKFLGRDYKVLSSFGHVRDLPKSETGVDTENDFAPTYEVPTKSKKHVTELKRAAKGASEILLATDQDREGEAIAWHIAELLKIDKSKMKRIVFHEITKQAIESAIADPQKLDDNLVNAQQARRILDRLVGYELSPLLWQTVRRGLSAGRVQSVALRLVVERERERNAFIKEEYWTIDAEMEKDKLKFEAKLNAIAGKKLDKLEIKNEEQASKIVSDLKDAEYKVSSVEKKKVKKTAPNPFTTSTLQIEANNKLGFSAKQTMRVAQGLYETGKITYMRTDSFNLAQQFIDAAQAFVKGEFGDKYVTGGRTYKTKKKGAQEAHEAIRPTDPSASPESLKSTLTGADWKLYDLIWSRALASQLPDAELERTGINIDAKEYTFRASGSMIDFDGFMKVYHSATEKLLPDMKEDDSIDSTIITPNQHSTEPPPRFSDATLVKIMEEHGIGRPSTYAPTIGTIIDREYVERDDNKKLAPTDTALIVVDMLTEHFPGIVDYEFTSKLEGQLDDIADGDLEWVPMLKEFYGPFHEKIESKSKTLKREDVMKEKVLGNHPDTKEEVIVRTGRFGPYLQLGRPAEDSKIKPKTISIPKDMSMETITMDEAIELLSLPRTVGTTADGIEILANIGRYGPYLKAEKKTASIPDDLNPLTIDEQQSRTLLEQAAEMKKKMMEPIAQLGEDPNSKEQILIKNGRFGPYVTDGKTNVSIPKKFEPTEVTAEIAIEMLVKKRERNEKKFAGKKAEKDAEKEEKEKKTKAKKPKKKKAATKKAK